MVPESSQYCLGYESKLVFGQIASTSLYLGPLRTAHLQRWCIGLRWLLGSYGSAWFDLLRYRLLG